MLQPFILEDIQMLLRLNTKALPTFSAALVLVPAMTIFFAAYMLAITVNFEVGLSLGILGLFTQFFILRTYKSNFSYIFSQMHQKDDPINQRIVLLFSLNL